MSGSRSPDFYGGRRPALRPSPVLHRKRCPKSYHAAAGKRREFLHGKNAGNDWSFPAFFVSRETTETFPYRMGTCDWLNAFYLRRSRSASTLKSQLCFFQSHFFWGSFFSISLASSVVMEEMGLWSRRASSFFFSSSALYLWKIFSFARWMSVSLASSYML